LILVSCWGYFPVVVSPFTVPVEVTPPAAAGLKSPPIEVPPSKAFFRDKPRDCVEAIEKEAKTAISRLYSTREAPAER